MPILIVSTRAEAPVTPHREDAGNASSRQCFFIVQAPAGATSEQGEERSGGDELAVKFLIGHRPESHDSLDNRKDGPSAAGHADKHDRQDSASYFIAVEVMKPKRAKHHSQDGIDATAFPFGTAVESIILGIFDVGTAIRLLIALLLAVTALLLVTLLIATLLVSVLLITLVLLIALLVTALLLVSLLVGALLITLAGLLAALSLIVLVVALLPGLERLSRCHIFQ